ncbi:hypothetical protein [Actinomarinicola tropica]|uniref:Glycosyltransferase RgtA/B/C/D-like domain-containing protein n=1 Tax=Actinomarinicola tropica TaxID=2789776 RepID=A0A5Q2RP21_9ACTN|nr:hypothetical protein [Actinomarinicola tropica]QGG95847.1 hypothetical protein GH723_12475 [Actinomarinicola tropica]
MTWTVERRAVVGVVALAVALAVHRAVALSGIDVTVATDEIGYIANARHLAGGYPDVVMTGTFYSVGASLLLVPIAALTSSPTTLHVAGIMVNVALASLLVVALHQLLRRHLGAGPTAAFAGAAVAGTIPWITTNAATLWSETLLSLLVVVWLLAVGRLRPGHRWAPVGLALCSVGLYAVHARTIAMLGLAVALVAAATALGRVRPSAAGLAALVAVVGVATTRLLNRAIAEAVYLRGQDAAGEGTLGKLRWEDVGSYLDSLAGQSWGLLVSTFGLLVPGVWFLGRGAWQRRREVLARETGDADADADTSVGRFDPIVAGAALAVLAWFVAVSTAQIGTGIARLSRGVVDTSRGDLLVYTRYVEPIAVVVAAAGVAWVLDRQVRARERFAVAGATVALLGALTLWIRSAFPVEWFDSFFSPSNASVVYAWIRWVDSFSPARIALPVAVLAGLAMALPELGRRLALVAAVVVSLALTSTGVADHLRFFSDYGRTHRAVPMAINEAGVDEVGFLAPWDGSPFYTYQFWLTDASYVLVDEADLATGPELLIAPLEWPGAARQGAVRVTADPELGTALWRLPG